MQVVNGSDILEVLHDYPELSTHVNSLYNCQYDQFFRTLSKYSVIPPPPFSPPSPPSLLLLHRPPSPPSPPPSPVWAETEFKCDRYLAAHTRFYVREMRIKAYTQLLESYRSLSLPHMAKSFGVSVPFMDRYDRMYIHMLVVSVYPPPSPLPESSPSSLPLGDCTVVLIKWVELWRQTDQTARTSYIR